MAKDSSFDVVSVVDRQEVDNAVNQANKELSQRFDFKGTGAEVTWTGDLGLQIDANSDHRVLAALDVLKEKLIKRGVSTKVLQHDAEPKPAGGNTYRMAITINQGISTDKAKEIVKKIKDQKLKVQASIQGDQVRVSSKSRDELQTVIGLLKDQDFGIPLQFENYR
ncbi:MAG: YajQ family cyclic di-GMP-binding protein [Actinomycetota bacterium]